MKDENKTQKEKDKDKEDKERDELNKKQEYFIKQFRKEVDFHHKVAYFFEKAYRVGKKMPDRRKTLGLEIIGCIGEHSSYIETDHMALFYCLFFCIYYKNHELVEFLRSMIVSMSKSNDKIDKLLEFIDVNGLEKIRTVGEQIN